MGLRETVKGWIDQDFLPLRWALSVYNHFPLNNRFRLRGNQLVLGAIQLKGCTIDISGRDNIITIGSGSRLHNTSIHVQGSGHRIHIGRYVYASRLDIAIEDSGSTITIGDHTSFAGRTDFGCIEGCDITIGQDCMFSANITLRNGDSHSILDLEGRRINPSRSITLGDHVWVGNTVILTKGAQVGSHSILGAGSVVTRKFEEDHAVIAGNPAKIIKTGITWCRERI